MYSFLFKLNFILSYKELRTNKIFFYVFHINKKRHNKNKWDRTRYVIKYITFSIEQKRASAVEQYDNK